MIREGLNFSYFPGLCVGLSEGDIFCGSYSTWRRGGLSLKGEGEKFARALAYRQVGLATLGILYDLGYWLLRMMLRREEREESSFDVWRRWRTGPKSVILGDGAVG